MKDLIDEIDNVNNLKNNTDVFTKTHQENIPNYIDKLMNEMKKSHYYQHSPDVVGENKEILVKDYENLETKNLINEMKKIGNYSLVQDESVSITDVKELYLKALRKAEPHLSFHRESSSYKRTFSRMLRLIGYVASFGAFYSWEKSKGKSPAWIDMPDTQFKVRSEFEQAFEKAHVAIRPSMA